MTAAVRTTCPYCGVGCGVLASAGQGTVAVHGDPAHPANRGALCSKGTALGETVGLEGRLLRPRMHGQEVGWDAALDAVAAGFRRVIDTHGPDAVAFYVSGQMLTEDYYVANKLMKGFIGSANIDTNSRLCMSSAVAAHQRAFGEDLVPVSYTDLEQADLVILVGSNAAWCHPVLYQRIIKAKERRPGMRLVVLDPRRTATCDIADLHLPLRSGTDAMLFNGLLSWLSKERLVDHAFVEHSTRGAARALLAADNTAGDVDAVARHCGVQPGDLRRFYEWFGRTERVITAFSMGINQSSAGTDKANSIINVHLLTGRNGRAGMGPFSITGQPNAMGGREVGGLSNMLAAHMDLENPEHRATVQEFWNSPRMASKPGLKAVDLFEAIHAGRIRAVWIMATNPIVSLPNADRAREALRRCELVVVSDCVAGTDTAALAHVLLPAAAWGEKSGTVTNSDRHISRQRAFLPLPGAARPDWWTFCQVARRMGYHRGFDFETPAQIFDEHARLSTAGNSGQRAFDLGGLVGLGEAGYAELQPVQWPVRAATVTGDTALFADQRFYHPDRRARLIAVNPRPPKFGRDEEFPLVLNTGRIRDQWHSMTRSGRSPRLAMHLPEPFVDLHSADALAFGLAAGSLVRVVTRWGSMVARLRTSGEMARGSIFVPIHWNGSTASDARVGALTSPAVDPVSGEPEFKHTPARVEPFIVSWYGFALSRRDLALHDVSWWACATGASFRRYELAGRRIPKERSRWAQQLLEADTADWIEYEDVSAGTYRAVELQADRIQSCLFVAARPQLPSREWLAGLFAKATLSASDRASVLAGRPRDPGADSGAVVCSCHGVGRRTIEAAIGNGCKDPAAIGRLTRAGTNCGSCVPELRRIIGDLSEVSA
ncbi:MAG TPA: molybdopterin-dependent oxidoreductase [Steroidobacteraceae bacterium]|nr:molybdopterin-dependent oxidoreductase [Steroidobacteraceae bacterium]